MGLTRIRAEQISDIDYKQAVRVITTSDITLSGGAPSTVDGVSLVTGDRVLVSANDPGSENGIYEVQTVGAGSTGTWIRASDGNTTGELQAGLIVMVTEGDTYKDTQWKLTTNNPIIIGTTPLVFEQNSAFAFGNIYANSTAVLATSVGDSVTFAAGNNISILGNNTSKTVTIGVTGISLNSISNGISNVNVVSSGGNVTVGIGGTSNVAVFAATEVTVKGNILPSANVTYSLGSTTQRWKDLWVANSTIYLGETPLTTTGNTLLVNGLSVVTSTDTTSLSLSGNITGGNLLTSALVQGATVSASGNVVGGNANITSAVNSTTISASGNITGGNVLTGGIISAGGNITGGNLSGTNIAGTLSTASQPNITSVGTLTSLSVTGNINSGNVAGTQGVFTNIAGTLETAAQTNITSVGTLTSLSVTGNINSGNVAGTTGTFTNVGGTLTTAAQPNITSVGTLGGLTVTGLSNYTGNIDVVGNINVTGNLNYSNVTDLVVGDPLIYIGANNTGNLYDLGMVVAWNDGTYQHGGWVRDASDGTWKLFGNVIPEPTTTVDFTNANYQPMLAGAISSTGNITSANLVTGGLISATGNITGGNLSGTNIAGTLSTASQPNITSVGTLTSASISGNVQGGNLRTAGLISATGNITGGNILGNGASLTGINAFSTVAVTGGDSAVADSIADTLTLTAGDGITLVMDSGTDTLTIAVSGGSAIFVDGADFGTVTEIVTLSDDLGSVTEAVTSESDLGTIVTSGILYPDQLVLPSYTTSNLPSAAAPGAMIYVTNETGGAVPAFADGTNWRRVTDRAVVS